jgi:hypothetical protein
MDGLKVIAKKSFRRLRFGLFERVHETEVDIFVVQPERGVLDRALRRLCTSVLPALMECMRPCTNTLAA